ncbi:MAG: hypothetical protein AAF340_01975 [Pseudomonadota bacterium]
MNRLNLRGFPKSERQIIAHGDKVETALTRAKVHSSAVAPYASLIAKGHAVLVVRANYKPLGAARIAREILAKFDTVDAGAATQEYTTSWEPERAPSVMKDHPLFLTLPGMATPGLISKSFGMRLTKPHKSKRTLTTHGKPMSRMFWPMKLISTKERSSSVISGGRQMSKMFWPQRLLSTGERKKSVIPGGGTPFSSRTGFRMIS